MLEVIKFVVGIILLLIGIIIGNWLGKITKEELKAGQIWFKLIIIICVVGAVLSLFFGNDVLLFSFLFIAIVTSRSFKK
ncbi:MAG: hypothetical protein KKF48_02095 [Nanoarchaeota archaeon]|nr:hypothetical protein [Nanoarchaeota archaeon]MBU1027811.1 hypothetical protein [Nanoarchaeota archaeon]